VVYPCITLISGLFEKHLRKLGAPEEFIVNETKKLPGYLADIATNMGGHRGKSRGKLSTSTSSGSSSNSGKKRKKGYVFNSL